MANEIRATYDSGENLYALIFDAAGQVWDSVGSNWENYDAAQQDNYDIALSEIATNSGQYRGTFPAAITAGIYTVSLRLQSGGSAVSTDERIGESAAMHWDGSAEITVSDIEAYVDKIDDATDGLTAIKAEVEGLAGEAMRGTDTAALASVCTETRLSKLDAAVSSRSSHSAADVTGGTTVAQAESNIRGVDSDTLKTLSDQIDSAGAEYRLGLTASYDGTTVKVGLWLEESGQRQTDVTSITDVEIFNAAT
ncbi:MAG: hypothetical protein GWP14_08875, partial [Actinobacteria bacterium]|nr:hypothetical protein [Actinomycetota bacterium]